MSSKKMGSQSKGIRHALSTPRRHTDETKIQDRKRIIDLADVLSVDCQATLVIHGYFAVDCLAGPISVQDDPPYLHNTRIQLWNRLLDHMRTYLSVAV